MRFRLEIGNAELVQKSFTFLLSLPKSWTFLFLIHKSRVPRRNSFYSNAQMMLFSMLFFLPSIDCFWGPRLVRFWSNTQIFLFTSSLAWIIYNFVCQNSFPMIFIEKMTNLANEFDSFLWKKSILNLIILASIRSMAIFIISTSVSGNLWHVQRKSKWLWFNSQNDWQSLPFASAPVWDIAPLSLFLPFLFRLHPLCTRDLPLNLPPLRRFACPKSTYLLEYKHAYETT